jgi:TPP-dependent pyruvate/acetoin dehydrogenase alpha subunit
MNFDSSEELSVMKMNTEQHDVSGRLLESLYTMWLIRLTEDRCEVLFREAKVRGAMHLCSGQEAVAVGVCRTLSDWDRLLFTYRSHGWALARGMAPEALFGELFGRDSGCSRGRGGSKHLCDWERGIFPSNAIVGAGIPMANGVALAAVRKREPRVVVTVFGEGATNQGVLYESMAQAVIWKLPVIFACENNLYAEVTPAHEMRPTAEVVDLAKGSGIESSVCDGMDVDVVEATMRPLVDRARDGGGPAFVEFKTYRFAGHMTGDRKQYRSDQEIAQWRLRDPLVLLAERLRSRGVGPEELDEVRARAQSRVQAAETAAWNSPEPAPDSLNYYTSRWAVTAR